MLGECDAIVPLLLLSPQLVSKLTVKIKYKDRIFVATMPPAAAARAAPVRDRAAPLADILRQYARPNSLVFESIFKDGDLTRVQKTKQFINCVIYEAGKIVQRAERMTTEELHIEMNKAYYCRLQVIFADVGAGNNYWANNLGFDLYFRAMMTHTFGSGNQGVTLWFDYGNNQFMESDEIDAMKSQWTSPHLWKKYKELQSDMQNSMLPVLLKCRIAPIAGGNGYEFKTGGCFAEVTFLFKVTIAISH